MSFVLKNEKNDISLHDQIIGALPPAKWLRSKTLLDNRWIIGTEDPTKRRNTNQAIIFDVPILPGEYLSHEQHESDLITAKLLTYYSLHPSEGIFTTAAGAGIFVRSYIQFVRWRLSRGIRSNSSLSSEWLEDFFETLRERGVRGLIPIEERAALFAQAVRAGETEPPTYRKGKRVRFDFDVVARAMGVSNGRLLTNEAQSTIVRLADDLGFKLQPYQLRSIGFARALEEDSTGSLVKSEDAEPKAGVTSWSRIANFLRPLEFLWRMRGRLTHDPLTVDPFPGERTPTGVAKALSAGQQGRTFTVPPLQACTLIDKALTWVLDYAEDIKRYVQQIDTLLDTDQVRSHWYPYQAAANLANREFDHHPSVGSPGSPWPIRAAFSPGMNSITEFSNVRPALRTILYEYLPVSCMIVIAAFSARRREEIESLRNGCISYDDGEPWLETWIEKTVRDLDKIPVPVSVVKAIDVLVWLSKDYRRRTGEPWLFCFDEIIKLRSEKDETRTATFMVYRSLARFSRFVGVPPLLDGSQWDPKPHEFRRFFGVVYYHHYRFPHLPALSNYLRHFDPDITRRYISEAARGGFLRRSEERKVRARMEEQKAAQYHRQRLEDFDDQGEAFRVERFRNVALGKERMSGWGGELLGRQLYELVDQAKLQLDLSPEADLPEWTLDQIIEAFSKGKRLEPNSLGHSYCKCTTDLQDLRSAGCLTARAVESEELSLFSAPDPAYAADSICSACPHNVQFAECEAYWLESIAHEEEQQSCVLGPLLRALSGERLEMARAHHARCFG